MVQNRNKLIELFIGNISNAVIHEILEKAVIKEIVADKYRKELLTSFEIAKRYREKINPINRPLPGRDAVYIKEKIINKVKTELMTRVSRGYKNINIEVIEELVDKTLKNTEVI
ncbi:MAG: hypothetical protein AABY22_00700 [Nanoarchaeota archaeon]